MYGSLLGQWSKFLLDIYPTDIPQLCFVATAVLLTVMGETGGTRHKAAFTLPELEYQIKLQMINLVFWIAATLFGKMAVGLTILRLINRQNKWHAWPVNFVIYFMNLTCILDTFLILFRCGNPANLWDLTKTSTCLDSATVYNFNVFAAAWQVLVDFFMAFFPMYILWGLKMASRRRKYTLMALLGLTTFTGVAAAVKTSVAQRSLGETADSTWDVYVLAMWAATEIMLIIACGSVPAIFPLWEHLFRSDRGSHSHSHSQEQQQRWKYSTSGEYSTGKHTTGSSSSKHLDSRPGMQTAEEVDVEMAQLVAGRERHVG